MRSFRFLPAGLLAATGLACGAPAPTDLAGDTDELSDATVSMEMVRKNPSLAPSVAVPYFSGSRLPSRFRLGPLRHRMFVTIGVL